MYPLVKIGNFNIKIVESVDSIKKYQFVEIGMNHWRKGFTEIYKLGMRYFIKHTINEKGSVCNLEDLESFVKYYTRLS